MEKLNEFIIKQLNDSKVQRWIIKATDLFTLCNNMGILDDDELMIDIIEYLENNEIDINFVGGDQFYKDFLRLENKVKMGKMLRGSKTEFQLMIEKIESIRVPERPTWLEMYRDDSTDEKIESSKMEVSDENPYQRITNMITQELRDQIENEPTPTIEELIGRQMEIENEMRVHLENAPIIINKIRNNIDGTRNIVDTIRHEFGINTDITGEGV